MLASSMIALAVMREGQITFANPAFCALFRSTDALVDVDLASLVNSSAAETLTDALSAAKQVSTRYFGTGWRFDGSSFDLELCLEPACLDGEPLTVTFAWDVSDQHQSQEQLVCLAYTDSLTGLANRPRL